MAIALVLHLALFTAILVSFISAWISGQVVLEKEWPFIMGIAGGWIFLMCFPLAILFRRHDRVGRYVLIPMAFGGVILIIVSVIGRYVS